MVGQVFYMTMYAFLWSLISTGSLRQEKLPFLTVLNILKIKMNGNDFFNGIATVLLLRSNGCPRNQISRCFTVEIQN